MKASVSEVAANTTTVPVTFPDAALPDADALPDAAALDAEVLPDAAVPLDDELHAASAAASRAADAPARIVMRCRGRRERDERLTWVLPLRPADGTFPFTHPSLT